MQYTLCFGVGPLYAFQFFIVMTSSSICWHARLALLLYVICPEYMLLCIPNSKVIAWGQAHCWPTDPLLRSKVGSPEISHNALGSHEFTYLYPVMWVNHISQEIKQPQLKQRTVAYCAIPRHFLVICLQHKALLATSCTMDSQWMLKSISWKVTIIFQSLFDE